MRECDKSKNTYKRQLPIVYMSFNNVGHLITSTITTLQHFATLYYTSWFQAFAVFRMLFVFFWVIPQGLIYICRHLPLKMEQIECSETSAYINQTPGNHPKENKQLYYTSPNYTSLHLSTLHFLSFTLHYSPIWLNPSTFIIVLFHLTSLN